MVYQPDHLPVLPRRWSSNYGTTVMPARPGKPRDKAKVEVAVQIAQRWILARLRNEVFHSLEAMRSRVRELLDDLNARPMKKLGSVSRQQLFERLDNPRSSVLRGCSSPSSSSSPPAVTPRSTAPSPPRTALRRPLIEEAVIAEGIQWIKPRC